MKLLVTFGSGHLKEFVVGNPNEVLLVVEGKDFSDCRKKVFDFPGIGEYFCTSYDYSEKDDFINKYDMREYTLEDLNKVRRI